MGKFGVAAITAVRIYTEGKVATIPDAWGLAVQEIFPNSPSSQSKGCPKGTFLGICDSGCVIGVPSGEYTRSRKNKQYGLRALELLCVTPSLADDEATLWQLVLAGESRVPNSQMDVISSLWKAGLVDGTSKGQKLAVAYLPGTAVGGPSSN